MKGSKAKVKFKTTLVTSGGTTLWHFLPVPKEKVASFEFKQNLRRVVCTLNGVETFNCSLFPSKGNYFISINKKLRDRLGLKAGGTVTVELAKDESRFGMPIPEEFQEVLNQDREGETLFDKLTPGNQRLVLKLIVMVGDIDKRIHRALITMQYLKDTNGKFLYNELHERMKATTTANL